MIHNVKNKTLCLEVETLRLDRPPKYVVFGTGVGIESDVTEIRSL